MSVSADTLFQQPVVVTVDGVLAEPIHDRSGPDIFQPVLDDDGQLNLAFLTAALHGIDRTPSITREIAGMLVANILQWPVQSVTARAQVGRFVQVDYQPITAPDPDIIVSLDTGPAANAFHATMLQHQKARSGRLRDDPPAWYRRVRHSAIELVDTLVQMQACQTEAAFVLLWAIGNAAMGRTTPLTAAPSRQMGTGRTKPKKPKYVPIQTNPKPYDEGDFSIYDAMSMMG